MKLPFLFLASFAAALLCGSNGLANCCRNDADCPKGFACSGGVSPDGGWYGMCDSTFVACTCDTDCAPGLHCMANAGNVCTQPADGGAQTCHEQGRCVAAWQRPCSTSADCGPGGFQCTQNGTLCQGSSCQFTYSCTWPTLPASCTKNQDCPSGWTCEPDTAQVTACAPVIQHCPLMGCPPLTGALLCRPPYFDMVGSSAWSGPAPTPNNNCSSGGSDADVAGTTEGTFNGTDAGQVANFNDVSKSGCACQMAPAKLLSSPVLWVIAACFGVLRRRRVR